jgi:hypothetical protein
MSENNGSERQELKLKDCVAIPLALGKAVLATIGLALLTLCVSGGIVLVFSVLVHLLHTSGVATNDERFVTATGIVWGVSWLFVFVFFAIQYKPYREYWRKYWRRNFVGYNFWIWKNGEQIVSQICYRRQGARDSLVAPAMAMLLPFP